MLPPIKYPTVRQEVTEERLSELERKLDALRAEVGPKATESIESILVDAFNLGASTQSPVGRSCECGFCQPNQLDAVRLRIDELEGQVRRINSMLVDRLSPNLGTLSIVLTAKENQHDNQRKA